MVSFIKQRSFHSRMFKEPLLPHKEIQWLSRGKVLNRVSELKGVLWKQQKARFCWLLWEEEWLQTSQRGTDSSVSVRYEEMFLTSRDKILGFKRKMHFRKTSCYKKKSWIVSSAAWAWIKKGISSLKSYWKPAGEAAEQNWTGFPSFSTQMYHWWTFSWIFWLWEYLRKREEEPWSYTIKMSFTDLLQTSSGFLWRKEYPAICRKTKNIMRQFLTSHTFEQPFSYSMNIRSKLRNGLISSEKEICVC